MGQTNPHPIQPPSHTEVIAILDFGSQYAQLIARRVREAGAFSMLLAPDTPLEAIKGIKPKGIILSGGPSSVKEPGAPRCDERLFDPSHISVPILGICYGMQLGCQILGSDVDKAKAREYGRAKIEIKDDSDLFASVPKNTTVWMSHGDQVLGLAEHFDTLASTPTCPFAAVRHKAMPFFGLQFHPEVTHTPHGVDMLRNFLYEICKCSGTWRMSDFMLTECERIREQVGSDRVICGLSGGVDSSVVAALLAKAIGDQLTCIFVDNGLLRKNERELVETTFRDHFDIDLRVVDASEQFLNDLKGVTDPQEKRRRIGHRFIDVFKQVVARLSEPWTFLRLSEPEEERGEEADTERRAGEPARHPRAGDLCRTSVAEAHSDASGSGDAPVRPVIVTAPECNRAIIDLQPDEPLPVLKIDSFVGRDPFPKESPEPPDIEGYIRNLPHIELPGATYFVTWRTREGKQLSDVERDLVLKSILHWHGKRMEVYAACVMSNHVHCLIRPFEGYRLGDLIGGIKKHTALEINRHRGESGSLWLDERFDHIVRDEMWLTKFVYYILRNPVEAKVSPRPSEYRWTIVHPGLRTDDGVFVSASAQRADETTTGRRPVPPPTGRGPAPPPTGQEPASPSNVRFLAQGTLYPDVIESGHGYAGTSANIKLHHNVGGLPEELGFELVEPLRDLFKDEVRQLGEVLGLPSHIVWRHPFPGPGLAVRIIGEITPERLDLLRDCDEILLEEIIANNLYRSTNQVFAVLLPIQTVGVMGDHRSYESVVAIRAVETQDFMTADWAKIPYDVLATISNRIINEVAGVNRVVYDISSKPPATIEWE